MIARVDDERFFLLPHEDGSTIIINNSKKPNVPDIQVFRKYADISSHEGEEAVDTFLCFFPEEAKFKVAIFEEMLRTMPQWMENSEPWCRELCAMAANGISPDKKLRSSQDNLVLEWLLLAVSEPKIREIHESSFKALLELAEEQGPLPSKAFLLEYSEPKINDVSYGFLPADPGNIISLLYDFGEAGQSKCFTKSLSRVLDSLSDCSFALWGEVCPRYRCVLMLEFLSHPGVVPVEELRERSSSSGLLQNPGLHRITDTSQTRTLAVLLYDNLPAVRRRRKPNGMVVVGVWLMLAIHFVYSLHRLRNRALNY